jgi:hypothetical protein
VIKSNTGFRRIRNFLYSTWWGNTIGVSIAIQQHQAFSRIFDANILAANTAGGPNKSGSGIFSLGEPLAVSYSPDPTATNQSALIISKIPILDETPSFQIENKALVPISSNYERTSPFKTCILGQGIGSASCLIFEPYDIVSQKDQIHFEVSQNGLKCTLEIREMKYISTPLNVTWIFFALVGTSYYPDTIDPFNIEACGISFCSPSKKEEDTLNCVSPPIDSHLLLSDFTLQGIGFTSRTYVAPLLAVSDVKLADASAFVFEDIIDDSGLRTCSIDARDGSLKETMFNTALYGVRG